MIYCAEIVRCGAGIYYANVSHGGRDQAGIYHDIVFLKDMMDFVPYGSLKIQFWNRFRIKLPDYSQLIWSKVGKKRYARITWDESGEIRIRSMKDKIRWKEDAA